MLVQGVAWSKHSKVSNAPRRSLISLQGPPLCPQAGGKLPLGTERLHGSHRPQRGQTSGPLGASCPKSGPPALTAAILHPWRGLARCGLSQVKQMACRGGGTAWAKAGTGECPWGELACVPVSVCSGCHNTGRLKQQKITVSQFWRPGVQDQGVGRGVFFRGLRGSICSRPLPQLLVVCWQSLVFFGLETPHLDLCLYLCVVFSLCTSLCVSKFPLLRQSC